MSDHSLFKTVTAEGSPYLTVRLHDTPSRTSHVEITLHMDASGLRGSLENDRWVLLELIAQRVNVLRGWRDTEPEQQRESGVSVL